MADSEKIVQLHAEITPEERARRLGVEIARLAALPLFEWPLYLNDVAGKHGVAPAQLKQMVEATIKAREKKAREDRVEVEARERRAEKKKEKARREQREQERETERIERQQERADKEASVSIKRAEGICRNK
jgi:hypothetical protein